MLDQKQIKELSRWIVISEIISNLYDELSQTELLYGRESREYQKVAGDIQRNLELENEIEKEFFENSVDLYNIIVSFLERIDNLPGVKMATGRIISRLERDYGLQCDVFTDKQNKQVESIFGQNHFFPDAKERALDNIQKIIVDGRVNIFINIICRILGERKMLTLIDEEFEKEPDEKIRETMIRFKNDAIAKNKDLEQWYLGLGNSVDMYLIDDDEIMANFLQISSEDYTARKKQAIKTIVSSMEEGFLSYNDDYVERIHHVLTFLFRPTLSLLSPLEIEEFHKEFTERHAKDSSSLCVKVMDDAIVGAISDSKKDVKIKKMMPED